MTDDGDTRFCDRVARVMKVTSSNLQHIENIMQWNGATVHCCNPLESSLHQRSMIIFRYYDYCAIGPSVIIKMSASSHYQFKYPTVGCFHFTSNGATNSGSQQPSDERKATYRKLCFVLLQQNYACNKTNPMSIVYYRHYYYYILLQMLLLCRLIWLPDSYSFFAPCQLCWCAMHRPAIRGIVPRVNRQCFPQKYQRASCTPIGSVCISFYLIDMINNVRNIDFERCFFARAAWAEKTTNNRNIAIRKTEITMLPLAPQSQLWTFHESSIGIEAFEQLRIHDASR